MTKYINEFAEKWLQELETTTRLQGQDYLCTGDKFCCLGVAYDMEDVAYTVEDNGSAGRGSRRYDDPTSHYDKVAKMVLGETMRTKLGLKCHDGGVDEALDIPSGLGVDNYYESIAVANDSQDFNFKEMAYIIRHNAGQLFVRVEDQ